MLVDSCDPEQGGQVVAIDSLSVICTTLGIYLELTNNGE
jgi:hypothetical protein